MKQIITLLLCSLTILSYGQNTDSLLASKLQASGKYMQKYSSKMTAGYCLELAGGAIIGLGAINKSSATDTKANNSGFYVVGSGVAFVGILFQLTAQSYLNKAGISFQKAGIALSIPYSK